jgi:hypothetical protein
MKILSFSLGQIYIEYFNWVKQHKKQLDENELQKYINLDELQIILYDCDTFEEYHQLLYEDFQMLQNKNSLPDLPSLPGQSKKIQPIKFKTAQPSSIEYTINSLEKAVNEFDFDDAKNKPLNQSQWVPIRPSKSTSSERSSHVAEMNTEQKKPLMLKSQSTAVILKRSDIKTNGNTQTKKSKTPESYIVRKKKTPTKDLNNLK